jgi:hypothetical protein
MKIGKDPLGVLKLLNIAARVGALSMQASKEPLSHRVSGRLARDPEDDWAVCEVIVDGVKNADSLIPITTEIPGGRVMLHIAMHEVSMHLWAEMWNEAHPDQFGMGRDGEDIALMSVWREKVLAMIKECHEDAILAMTPEKYFDQLTTAGASEEDAEILVEWISLIQVGGTPTT